MKDHATKYPTSQVSLAWTAAAAEICHIILAAGAGIKHSCFLFIIFSPHRCFFQAETLNSGCVDQRGGGRQLDEMCPRLWSPATDTEIPALLHGSSPGVSFAVPAAALAASVWRSQPRPGPETG